MAGDGTAATGDGLPGRLLSDAEFKRTIDRLLTGPLAADRAVRVVVTSVERPVEIATYQNAPAPSRAPSHARTFFEDGECAVTCRCEVWRTGFAAPHGDAEQLMRSAADLVQRHWGDRDPATMLPYLKNAGVPARFVAAAKEAAAAGRPVAVLHTDLDHFKKVNDAIGETGGNAVLREFADRLREQFGRLGVVIRTGGEEFSVLVDEVGPGEAILAAGAFRRRMAAEPLRVIDRPNTCSVGLALFPDAEALAEAGHPDDVLSEARDAERRAKSDGRNRIALSGTPALSPEAQPVQAAQLRLAALSARRREPDDGNPGAALLAAVRDALLAAFARGSDATAAVAEVRDELSLRIGALSDPGRGRAAPLLGVLGALEWATAVAGALLASAATDTPMVAPGDALELAVGEDGALSVKAGDARIDLGCAVSSAEPLRATVGRPYYGAGEEPRGSIGRLLSAKCDPAGDPTSPVLLLPIGDDAKVVADRLRSVAAAVVDVDDRPARGGGLPDFWQSNVSRVAKACLANPNIGVIVAIGDTTYAHLTLTRLHQLANGDTEELRRPLPVTPEDLTTLASRDLKVVRVAADDGEVLAAIEEAVAELQPLDFADRPVVVSGASRRRLPIGSPNREYRLDVRDGLRTRTFADVYPEALQLIRGADGALDHVEPHRGTFREITGFKVVLTDPLRDPVADYWLTDGPLLDDYYARTFEDPAGLFGSRLKAPAPKYDGSLEEFAVTAIAEASAKKIPTRRVNLPITPDEIEQPLGLSCIQLMPRERDGASAVDAIFVWRTVDALVGFPFSAYGSIKWTEEFLDKVNARLATRTGAPRVRPGTLTYIALSFHMYLHDGDREIARTIVQDASL